MPDEPSYDPLLDLPAITFRDRFLDALAVARGDTASMVGGIALILLIAGGVWFSRSGDEQAELLLPMATAEMASVPEVVAATVAPADVVVHAAGAVRLAGLFVLPAGSRVDDLIAAAGGAEPGADLDRVNLASPLSDGMRVFIPLVGEAVPGEVAGDMGGDDQTGPVDINTADAAQLESLPGIGPATATAVVEHRTRTGAFRSVEDLLEVRGIGPAKLEQLRQHVTV